MENPVQNHEIDLSDDIFFDEEDVYIFCTD